jgi:hypothetical protein
MPSLSILAPAESRPTLADGWVGRQAEKASCNKLLRFGLVEPNHARLFGPGQAESVGKEKELGPLLIEW